MTSTDKVRHIILNQITPLGVERTELLAALDRVLAEDVTAPWDMPHFDKSAMDGFAVRSADCKGEETSLRITGYVPAGGTACPSTLPGCAVRIMTGAPIPSHCDAVVPVESTTEGKDQVTIRGAVNVHQHIHLRGEDVESETRF